MLCLGVASRSRSRHHLLVITGVGGDEEHAKKFHKWATTFIDAAKKKEAVPDVNITLPGETERMRAIEGVDRENVEKAFADIARERQGRTTSVFVLLIGHGSFDGTTAAFNLPGPDLTADDYARLLVEVRRRSASCSSTRPARAARSCSRSPAPGRVIVTATKTGGERNETRFPQFFVEAFGDDAADRDRNGRVSVGEAFDYAKAKVVASVSEGGPAPDRARDARRRRRGQARGDGVSRQRHAAAPRCSVDTSDPELRALLDERDALEQQIAGSASAKDVDGPRRVRRASWRSC